MQGTPVAKRRRILPRMRRNRLLPWMALILLLINAVSPAVAGSVPGPGASGPMQAALFDDPFDNKIVICTPTGLRIITLGDDGQPIEENADTAYQGICPFCPPLSSAAGSALPLLAGLLPPPPPAPDALFATRPAADAPASPHLTLVRAPRGPPSVS